MNKEIKLNEKNHQSIQKFLNKFNKFNQVDDFCFQFKCNPVVFQLESQLPDVWLKTRIPFNKNDGFYRETLSIIEQNTFPKVAFQMPKDIGSNEKQMKVTNVDLDDLFSGKETNNSEYKDLKASDEKERSISNLSVKGSSSNFERDTTLNPLGDDKDNSIKMKRFYLVIPDVCIFGPYNPEEIYIFVNNIFCNTSEAKENHTFMVSDSQTDTYYEPHAVLEFILEMCPELREVSLKGELEKLVIDNGESIVRERKFSDNPQIQNKFDIRNKATYSTAQYLPISQVRNRLRKNVNRNHNHNRPGIGYNGKANSDNDHNYGHKGYYKAKSFNYGYKPQKYGRKTSDIENYNYVNRQKGNYRLINITDQLFS